MTFLYWWVRDMGTSETSARAMSVGYDVSMSVDMLVFF